MIEPFSFISLKVFRSSLSTLQNGPFTDVQEDEEMDKKKDDDDDEDEDEDDEQEAKSSANLGRSIIGCFQK